MPELVPVWEQLAELAAAAMWRPASCRCGAHRYIAGCSQTVWIDPQGRDEPALLRNYDFAPALLEGNWLATRWTGRAWRRWATACGARWTASTRTAWPRPCRRRTVAGIGFGIPLVLRYVLETARNTAQAIAILQRVPVHMSYSVTLLDKADWATVFVGPDRPWKSRGARRSPTISASSSGPSTRAPPAPRTAGAMERQLDNARAQTLTETLLADPLYQNAWARGYGTLYTAVYRRCPAASTCIGRARLDAIAQFEKATTTSSTAPVAVDRDISADTRATRFPAHQSDAWIMETQHEQEEDSPPPGSWSRW